MTSYNLKFSYSNLRIRLSEHISLSIYYIRVSQERTVGELERRARIHEEHCRRESIERVRGRGKLQPLTKSGS